MPIAPYWNKVTMDNVKAMYTKKDYPFFDRGDYNLNLFGIRTNENVANTFNDVIGLIFKINGVWKFYKYDATVDPGLYWRQNLMNSAGTAIIQPGFYRGVYQIGIHRGKYEALTQKKPMKYWRDKNKDGVLDRSGKTYEEIAMTNLHRATKDVNGKSVYVNDHSAGCMVIADHQEFLQLMSFAKKAKGIFGNSFSFALFEEADLG